MAENKPTHRKHIPWHNYSKKCIYHITLVVSDRMPLFGRMVGETVDVARVEFTPLGQEIVNAIQMIPMMEERKGNDVQILGAATMPDHIHFVLFVRKPMKEKLGLIIRGFKQGCNKALRGWLKKAGVGGLGGSKNGRLGKSLLPNGEVDTGGSVGSPSGMESFPNSPMSALPPKQAAFLRQLSSCPSDRILREHALFEEDFDETRLRREGQLKSMIAYVHNNPRHRWLKQRKPEWLCVTRGIMIAGRSYDAIGNVNLLGLPRHQVHCRYKWERDHDLESRRNHQNECVIKARQNYALVSPFISPHEAAVRDFCLEEGHSVIVLHNNGFTAFSQCPGGLLTIA